jgi:hypothetical protein
MQDSGERWLIVCASGPAGAPAKSVGKYVAAAAAIGSRQRLLDLHYDVPSGQFRDYGLHTEDVQLTWQDVPQAAGQPPQVPPGLWWLTFHQPRS